MDKGPEVIDIDNGVMELVAMVVEIAYADLVADGTC